MPHQLIFTSAPRGLQAGRSGYCTVAHSRDLRERLILPLEQYSSYTHLVLPGQEETIRNPTVHIYRKFSLDGTEYRILSRIVGAGADHTGRSNFLAHHLIFEDDWRGLPSPAAILRDWPEWKDRWGDAPGYIDVISPGDLKPLGQAAGLPAANNEEYLAKAWDTPFTTFLQDDDVKADFEWMGTRDAPDPGKKIAGLFGASPEEQAELLKNFSGMLSAPDADERKLLDVFAYALDQRSQAAEQEGIDQARTHLDSEYEKINRLAERIAAVIGETQEKVDDYRQKYDAGTGDAFRLYQNCLADYITPAEVSTESAKAKRQDTVGKAQAEHQDALRQLESGQFPATGINPGYHNDLRTLADSVAETNHKLTGGIQKFEDKINENDRAEQLRVTKEREERLKKKKIQLASGGRPVGTAADYASLYRGTGKKKSTWPKVATGFAVVVALIVAIVVIDPNKNPSQGGGGGQASKSGDGDTSDGDIAGQDSQQVDNGPLSELQQLTKRGVNFNTKAGVDLKGVDNLKKWNRIYSEIPIYSEKWIKKNGISVKLMESSEKKTYYGKADVELEKWKLSIISAVLTEVGDLPDGYRNKDQIKDIKDLAIVTQWQKAYTQWRNKTNELSEVWGSLPKGLTVTNIIAKLDDRFEESVGISPPKFKNLLSDQQLYVRERDFGLKRYIGKSLAEINAILPKPSYENRPEKKLGPRRFDYIRKSGHTLKLHFVYIVGIEDYEVEKVELIRRN